MILCLDETGDVKKGKTTDYVSRQYIGNLGKTERGIVSVNAYRLTNLVLLIAIAYTFSTLKGQSLLRKGQKEYVSRLRKVHQVMTKNSKFLLGLYGHVWIIAQSFVQDWVEKLMRLNRNKLPFYQRGLRAMELIQQGL